MKKAFLKKTVGAVVAAATITSLIPLGVSAQWKASTDSTLSYTEEGKTAEEGNETDVESVNFDSNGNTKTGWNCDNETWYYNNNSGLKETGWIKDNGNWYYCNNSGAMQRGFVKVNGTLYYFNKSGEMQTGWIKEKGKWYYADSTGAIQTGVIKISEKTYYFNKSGVMQTGRVRIGKKVYRFDRNGQAIGNKIPDCDKEFDSNGNLVKPNNPDNDQESTDGETIPGNPDGDNNSNESEGNDNTTEKPEDDENSNGSESGNTTKPNNPENNNGSNGSEDSKPSNPGNDQESTENGGTNVDVNGLEKLPQNYPITIQSNAETKILELMNEKRTAAGLKPLTMDNTLLQVARYKSNHMIQYKYFDHTNPDGTKWTNWLKTLGYNYTATAENIAYNSYDPVELFNQWWNSSGHRQNMMNPSYTKVGIGVIQGNNKYMGTQTFSN